MVNFLCTGKNFMCIHWFDISKDTDQDNAVHITHTVQLLLIYNVFTNNLCLFLSHSLMFVFHCIFLMKFLTVPDTNNSIVNIELTKIKVTVRINLKWPNLDNPFYLVGRHVTFPVTTKIYIPWVELVFPTSKFGWL
jgi:hypothetical protein